MATMTLVNSTIQFGPTIQGSVTVEMSFSETEVRLDVPFSGTLYVTVAPLKSGLKGVGDNPYAMANIAGVAKEISIPVGQVRPAGNMKIVSKIPISINLASLIPNELARTSWAPDRVLALRFDLEPDIRTIKYTVADLKIS